uniref:Ovule protein n=1 Tax=Schistosoma curassoni TaxID=6186 RepID=A0A183KEG1_9TREM
LQISIKNSHNSQWITIITSALSFCSYRFERIVALLLTRHTIRSRVESFVLSISNSN